MSVQITVIEAGKIVDVVAQGIWRDPKSNKLFSIAGSAHPDFFVKPGGEELEDGEVEVCPEDHVLWIGR